MSTCTGCGTNNNGGIRPNLSCPPDLSQLLFRFIARNKLGIVKGKDEVAAFDMSQFFIPLNNYMMTSMNLCPDQSKRIEAGTSMDFGERREITEFDTSTYPAAVFGVGATMKLDVLEDAVIIETLSGIPADDYATFIAALKLAISASSVLPTILEFDEDNTTDTFSLRGHKYGQDFTYDLTLSDIITPAVESIPGSITQTALRYPNGAWKMMFLNIIFCSDCTDSSQQYVEYAYDSDVIANGESGATWRRSGPMIFLSGAEDVSETDMNKIETIYIRNTRECDVEIQAILAI